MSGRDAVENTPVRRRARRPSGGRVGAVHGEAGRRSRRRAAPTRRTDATRRARRRRARRPARGDTGVRADATGGHGMGDRSRRHGVPRPPPESTRRTGDRLAHPHPRGRSGRRRCPLPPDLVPADLLHRRLGAPRVRGPGRRVRARGRRLRAAAAGDPPSRARSIGGPRGAGGVGAGGARDLVRPRAGASHARAGPQVGGPALRASPRRHRVVDSPLGGRVRSARHRAGRRIGRARRRPDRPGGRRGGRRRSRPRRRPPAVVRDSPAGRECAATSSRSNRSTRARRWRCRPAPCMRSRLGATVSSSSR